MPTANCSPTFMTWRFAVLAQQQSSSNPPPPVQGALSAPSLLGHYLGGSGSDYQITDKSFNEFIYEMKKQGKLPSTSDPVPGVDGLSQATVSTYGTKYENAVGLAVLYFKGGKPVGYSDWWNFDPKPAGARSKTGEILVDTAAHLPGKPFLVLYGTTPPPSTIPRN